MAFKIDNRLTGWYKKYNKMYFDGLLPECLCGWSEKLDDSDVDLSGATLTIEDGDIVIRGIALNTGIKTLAFPCKLKRWNAFTHLVLLHEMVHVKLHPYLKHGKRFYEEITRLCIRGAFDGLI